MVRTGGNPLDMFLCFYRKFVDIEVFAVHSHNALLSSKYIEQLELSFYPVLSSYEDGFDFLTIEGDSLYVYSSTKGL